MRTHKTFAPLPLLLALTFMQTPAARARTTVPAARPGQVTAAGHTARTFTRGDDEAELRVAAERYFAALAREDADGLGALWSQASPDYEAAMKSLRGMFAALDRIEARDLRVLKSEVGGDRARLLVWVELSAVIAQNGQRYPGWGKGHRRMELVREGGAWKVWGEASPEEELADLYVKAATEEERGSLLAREPELVDEVLSRRVFMLGKSLYDRNRYAESLPPLRLALALSERLHFPQVQADALKVIALAERLVGDYDESFKSSFRSLALYRQVGDRDGEARVLNNLGLTYNMRGDYTRAVDYYRQSLAIFEELKMPGPVGATLTSLGTVSAALGDNARALEFFGRGLTLAREVKDRKSEGNTLTYMGDLYGQQGNYELALEHLTRALELFTALKDSDGTAMALNNIGVVYRRQDDNARALDCYQRALKLYEEMGSKSHIAAATGNVGSIYRELGDHAQALAHYERALQMFEAMDEKPRAAAVLSSMAYAYESRGDHVKAREYAGRAAELSRQVGQMSVYQGALTTAGRAALGLNRIGDARKAFEEAINTVEALREQVAGAEQERGSFFEHRAEPYREMVGLLVSQKDTAGALAYAERAKGRVLLDVLHGGRADVSKAMTAPEREQERELKAALYALNSQLAGEARKKQPDGARVEALNAQVRQARLALEDFRNRLFTTHPELRMQRGEAPALRPEELAGLTPAPDTALVEYVVGEERTFLFVLTGAKGGGAAADLQVYTIPAGEAEIARRAGAFVQQIARRNLNFGEGAGGLYELLVRPAARQLEGTKALVIVPDGPLWNLPFQAVRDGRGRYLLEAYAVSYAPSLSVLAAMTRARGRQSDGANNAPTLLALGNPEAGDQATPRAGSAALSGGLAPLPEAERQVTELSRIYGAGRSRVYTGAEATEEHFKAEAGGYRVLQLAAHGILNDSNPMYSHIVLSRAAGRKEDGLLEAWEMMDLNLRADLVVLSACETARGRVSEGEGVIGMSWALFVAGAPATVVSQWKVDSASTTELMLGFHKNLRAGAGGAPAKAEALRRAALSLMRTPEYRHPFYWAGFIVVGDAR